MCRIINYLYWLLLLFAGSAFSQGRILGKVLDSAQVPLPYLAVALINPDSSVVKGSSTDDAGVFVFDQVKPGNYSIKVAAIGYEEKYVGLFHCDSGSTVQVDPVVLKINGVSLNEVSVTTIKKLVEFKNGNITINVENSPLAVGNSLYDLLSRMPGVSVIDDAITIQGKSGIRIMIDDRIQQFSGQQLINLLKSINASNIEKIEIMKNPPVKYDAAGSGFISVKTKKTKITGFSGSANVLYQQGFYSDKNAGLTLNYKGKSFAVFSSVNVGNDEFLYRSLFNKAITFNGVTTDFNQVTAEKNSNRYVSYNAGLDWYVNKKNTVGFKIEGSEGIDIPTRHGNNYLSDSTLGYSRLEFGSVRPNTWNYLDVGVNAEHLFDTVGTKLRFTFDYSPNLDLNSGDFENHFLNANGEHVFPSRMFRSDNNLRFVILTSRLDFEKQLTQTLKLETGLKGNDQRMFSNYNLKARDEVTGEYLQDTAFANVFSYRELIPAAYVNLLKQWKKVNVQAGMRGENTNVVANSQTRSVQFTRQYFNLFPMMSVSFDPSDKHSFQLSYNRRIERPDFTSFNPYKFFVNLFVSFQGNPYLMPSYYNVGEFTYGYKSTVYQTLSFTKTDNFFYNLPVQNDSTKETMNKTVNLANSYMGGYSLFIQKELGKTCILTLNGNANYIDFRGRINDKDFSGTSFQYFLFLNSQFLLPRKIKVELSAQYLSPGNVVIAKNKPRWGMNIALRKAFLDGKLNFIIGVNDVFYTMVVRSDTQYQNLNTNLKITNDTRRFRTSLTYNFGKVKVQKRQLQDNEEEKGRLNH